MAGRNVPVAETHNVRYDDLPDTDNRTAASTSDSTKYYELNDRTREPSENAANHEYRHGQTKTSFATKYVAEATIYIGASAMYTRKAAAQTALYVHSG